MGFAALNPSYHCSTTTTRPSRIGSAGRSSTSAFLQDRARARGGKAVAQITAVDTPRKRIDVAALRAMTDAMPMQPETARDFIRRMRDEDRY
jgi:hypothetical protein